MSVADSACLLANPVAGMLDHVEKILFRGSGLAKLPGRGRIGGVIPTRSSFMSKRKSSATRETVPKITNGTASRIATSRAVTGSSLLACRANHARQNLFDLLRTISLK